MTRKGRGAAIAAAEDVDPGVDDLVEVRMLVPRRALVQEAPAAEMVSQESSLELFGVPPRRFLELVRSPRFPGRVLRLGRLRRTDLLSFLEQADETPEVVDESPRPTPATSLVERLGLEEVPRPRSRRGRKG